MNKKSFLCILLIAVFLVGFSPLNASAALKSRSVSFKLYEGYPIAPRTVTCYGSLNGRKVQGNFYYPPYPYTHFGPDNYERYISLTIYGPNGQVETSSRNNVDSVVHTPFFNVTKAIYKYSFDREPRAEFPLHN